MRCEKGRKTGVFPPNSLPMMEIWKCIAKLSFFLCSVVCRYPALHVAAYHFHCRPVLCRNDECTVGCHVEIDAFIRQVGVVSPVPAVRCALPAVGNPYPVGSIGESNGVHCPGRIQFLEADLFLQLCEEGEKVHCSHAEAHR